MDFTKDKNIKDNEWYNKDSAIVVYWNKDVMLIDKNFEPLCLCESYSTTKILEMGKIDCICKDFNSSLLNLIKLIFSCENKFFLFEENITNSLPPKYKILNRDGCLGFNRMRRIVKINYT